MGRFGGPITSSRTWSLSGSQLCFPLHCIHPGAGSLLVAEISSKQLLELFLSMSLERGRVVLPRKGKTDAWKVSATSTILFNIFPLLLLALEKACNTCAMVKILNSKQKYLLWQVGKEKDFIERCYAASRIFRRIRETDQRAVQPQRVLHCGDILKIPFGNVTFQSGC